VSHFENQTIGGLSRPHAGSTSNLLLSPAAAAMNANHLTISPVNKQMQSFIFGTASA